MKIIKKILNFYISGFKSMTVGKKLWIIIFIKLFVMFAILKLFFFHDILETKFKTDKDRSDFVIQELTSRNNK